MIEKIEAFWTSATADDVAKIANTRKSIQARFRDEDNEDWVDCLLTGWKLSRHLPGAVWIDADGASWAHCQVYREPSWYTNKPDPGPGYRLLGKFPDEELKPGDEGWDVWNDGEWGESDNANDGKPQSSEIWYRRRIEQLLSGHRWLVSGDRLESGDLYYEKGSLLEVGHEYWGNNVMLTEAFMRKIEQPKPEPKHYVLRVGDSVETPSGQLVKAVSPGVEQIEFKLRAGFTAKLPNGQTITATEKGYEVTQ
jgi:hypothetical protein